MNKATKFISGNEYNLSQLFGGDNKIVIPDLQRDYCWGDNAFVSSNDKLLCLQRETAHYG